MNSGRFISNLLVLVFLASQVTLAQMTTGTILGTVSDSTGAVIPGANLTARNVETGLTRTTVSGSNGAYRLVALPVGNYEVQVSTPGFRAEVRSGLTLTVGQEAVVNFTLQVGAVEQRIEVTAEAPLVNTTSGSLGGLVNEERVAELPLNGRNFVDLALLQTGVVQNKNMTATVFAEGTWFSSNGAMTASNNLLLDGASMRTMVGGTSSSINGSTLGVDGIREFRVVTNNFSAEYGMVVGSQTVMVSKSGTNQFHGSLFEYLRNDALDARNFFDYHTIATSRRLPPFKRNQFGAAVGGPIKQDKTFFYAVYEGIRQRLGVTPITNTIPKAARVDGGLVPQIAPIVKPWLPLFPEPNLPGDRLTFPANWPSREDYGQIRMDQTFSATDTLFGRFTIQDSDQLKPLDWPQFKEPVSGRYVWLTVAEDHIFSPALLNTVRFHFSRNRNEGGIPLGKESGPQFSFMPGQLMGNVNIGGVTLFATGCCTPMVHHIETFTWSDDLYYTRGRHSLKFGTLINRFMKSHLSPAARRGAINFTNIATFLLGQPSLYTAPLPNGSIFKEYYWKTLGFYVQDDWRVKSNLTLNLGLRYEIQTTFKEANGVQGALLDVQRDAALTIGPIFKNPSLGAISPRFGFAWDVRGDGKTAVRGGFGLLYDIANLGITFTGKPSGPPFTYNIQVINPGSFTLPFNLSGGLASNTLGIMEYEMAQPHMLSYNLTVDRQLPFDMALTTAYGGSRGINLIQAQEANPNVPQILAGGTKFWPATGLRRINPNWGSIGTVQASGSSWYNSLQVGLMKRLSKGLQLQSSYTWSKVIDENNSLGAWESGGENNTPMDPFDRRRSHGPATFDVTQNWRFNATYHLPELISGGGVAGKLLNGWAMSGILALNSGYPFSPVIQNNRSRSGVQGSANKTDLPDLVAGRTASDIVSGVTAGCAGVTAGQKLGGHELYYDPCAFRLPPAGFLGNLGRNFLRGPGFKNLDFSLTKDTALGFLGESGRLQFRAEFFNILNLVNFYTPSRQPFGGVGSNIGAVAFAGRSDGEAPLSTAGNITNTVGTSRQIQFALKILF